MNRKILSFITALALCAGLSVPVFAAEEPTLWAREQVARAVALGIVPQIMQQEYTKATTRAEFCALAVKLCEDGLNADIPHRKTFTDTADVNVEKMGGLGVVDGVGDGKFAPDDTLSREQAAIILTNLAETAQAPLPKNNASFSDSEKISAWALEQVGQVQAAGIMKGVKEHEFAPKDSYTREQSITTMMRIYDFINSGTAEAPPTSSVPTAAEVYESMIALKPQYPEGMSWTNDNKYDWAGGIFSGGYGCAGFAFILSDAAFGKLPARRHTDFSDIRVGDVLRVDADTHSVIVLSIDGQNITVAEGNYNYSIHWGRVLTRDELVSTGDYILTRYPE